jgi:4-amino-4-deoxy-L-arabinose transferase-like glycosyltransferase
MAADNSEQHKSLGRFLLPSLIVAASFAVRAMALLHWGRGPIESEGAEYARIAENLRHGLGYVGIVTPGTELMFPPLFPLLIASASFFTRNYTLAGRLVSLVFGAFLPLPAFGIAARLFNRRVGFIAAALFILSPLFISLSVTVMTEGPYATLLLSGVYAVLCALECSSLRTWSVVGAVFGIAYLLRPEAVAPFLIAVFFAVTATEDDLVARVRRAAVAILVFLALASPGVAFIYQKTGSLKFETKSSITSPLAVLILDKEAGTKETPAMQSDEAMKWASTAIDGDLKRIGIWLRPEVEVARDRVTSKDMVHIVAAAIRQNMPLFFQALTSRWLGAPFLPALALLGALRRPWRRPVAVGRLYFTLVPATAIVASFVVLWIFTRYYFVLVPFLSIWAANGLWEVGLWTKASLRNLGWTWPSPTFAANVVPSLLGLLLVIYPAKAIRNLWEFQEGSPANHVTKDVGLWIKQQQNAPVTVMDRYTPLAFHAGSQFVYFPYCSGDLALRFLDAAEVDYVVLRRDEKFSPYYDEWFTKGIPDPRAQLVYVSSGSDAGKIVVFRWHRANSHFPEPPKPSPISLEGQPAPQLPTMGPLHVDPLNRRYFADRHGKAVLLAGSHTWGNLQDFGRLAAVPFNYNSYLDYLSANGRNFMRLYSWEQANWALWAPYDWRIWPNAYLRTGPGTALDGGLRFDLEKVNPEYFARVRQRVKAARDRGIYVTIMLFNGLSIERKEQPFENPWRGHPFNRANNINGVDGDQNGDGEGREIHSTPDARIERFQEKYVAGVIDAVSDLDNVLYEISNEDHPGSMAWQSRMVEFVRHYESMKGVRHPVGITVEFPGGNNQDLFKSPADYISPNPGGGYDHDPPAATGDKVIVADTDHIFGTGGDRFWLWKSLTRGLNILLMDPYDNAWGSPPVPETESSHWSELRQAIGYARLYLSRLDLSAMIPRGELTTSHYCLADTRSGIYLVYIPEREAVEVDTSTSPGMLQVEWFEPATGKIIHAAGVSGGKTVRLLPPYYTDAVLLLQASVPNAMHKPD